MIRTGMRSSSAQNLTDLEAALSSHLTQFIGCGTLFFSLSIEDSETVGAVLQYGGFIGWIIDGGKLSSQSQLGAVEDEHTEKHIIIKEKSS